MSKFKGKIKGPLRRQESSVDVAAEYDASWAVLEDAFHGIHQKNAGDYLFENLYRKAYGIVLKKNGARLYAGFKTVVEGHLDEVNAGLEHVWRRIGKAATPLELQEARAAYLVAVSDAWSHHLTSTMMMSDVLMYLDKVYAKQANEPVVYEAGLVIFKDRLLGVNTGERLTQVLLDLVEEERRGALVPRAAMKSTVDILASLSTPYETFEDILLTSTREFYEKESLQMIDQVGVPEYLQYAERRLKEEDARVEHYLVGQTLGRLRRVVEHELVAVYMRRLLEDESGLSRMVDGRTEDLSRLFRLVSLVDPETIMHDAELSTIIVKAGSAIPCDRSGSLKWVEDVLALRDRYERLLTEAYGGSQHVANTITRAFSDFVDRNPRAPEFISLFIDDHMKRGLKGKTEAEVADVLDKTVALFRFVSDKDVFERYYKTHLAKRLLGGRSVSDDAERGLISKLKLEVGSTFTSKMEGMFKDMRVSADMAREYKRDDLSVSVLTSTYWPVTSEGTSGCVMPASVEAARASFTQYYLQRHSGRQLTWLPSQGTADIRATFNGRKYELNVSTYAMVVLMAVGDDAVHSYAAIKTATGIEDADLVRTLQSLACGKYRVLTKTPKSRDVAKTDVFQVNNSFTAPTVRIKIAQVAGRAETDTERKETISRVEETRKHQIEAAIVRTMKARQQMDYNNLVTEVTRQLAVKFMPDPSAIKARIESLIEREYLERDALDRRMYRYLA
ncbi:hypothetical protein PYCC9005_005438 [Savitreella phatthalungensis]